MTSAPRDTGSVRDTKAHLSDIVRTVAAERTHYQVGKARPPRAIIVPAAHAIPVAALPGVLAAVADTCAATILTDGALPEGVSELLTWWASLNPAPVEIREFLTVLIASVATQHDDELTPAQASEVARDVVCAYTGWSRRDWAAYTR